VPVNIKLTEYEDKYVKEMEIWIKSLEVSLKNNTKKTMLTFEEWIDKMMIAGVEDREIERRVKQAFMQGNGPFATFKNTFLRRITGTMNMIERVPRDVDKELQKKYTWITMFSNSCEDCEALHGETRTWSEWLDLGLPGSGHTQCQDNCNCELVEEAEMGPDLLRAIDLAEERRKEIVETGGAVHTRR